MTSLKSTICILFLTALSCLDAYAEEYQCAKQSSTIDSIEYDNERYYLVFTLKKSPNNKMVLSPSSGVDKARGRAMVLMLLTAYATGQEVDIGPCVDGDMDQLTIQTLSQSSMDNR